MERKQGTYQKEFRVMTKMSSANKDSFASFFPIGCPLFLFLDLLDWLGPPVNGYLCFANKGENFPILHY